jgi:hypothetical protein
MNPTVWWLAALFVVVPAYAVFGNRILVSRPGSPRVAAAVGLGVPVVVAILFAWWLAVLVGGG